MVPGENISEEDRRSVPTDLPKSYGGPLAWLYHGDGSSGVIRRAAHYQPLPQAFSGMVPALWCDVYLCARVECASSCDS